MLDIRFTLSAVAVVLPAALLTAAIVAAVSYRHRTGPLLFAWRLLAVVYGALLVSATFFPFQVVIGKYAGTANWWDSINWIPILTIDVRTFLLNVVLTLPLGVLVPVLTRWRTPGAVLIAGLVVSGGIEVLQYACQKLLSTGRTFDVNDILANVLGAGVGYLVYRLVAARTFGRRMLPPTPAGSAAS